jgi:hypothetical protein
MKDLFVLLMHLLTTLAKLMGPGGAKAVVADSLLMKQQLLVINRSRQRAPNLSVLDRFLLGFWSLFLSPHHILRAAVIIKPSTLLNLHEALKKRKYRLLFSAQNKGQARTQGPLHLLGQGKCRDYTPSALLLEGRAMEHVEKHGKYVCSRSLCLTRNCGMRPSDTKHRFTSSYDPTSSRKKGFWKKSIRKKGTNLTCSIPTTIFLSETQRLVFPSITARCDITCAVSFYSLFSRSISLSLTSSLRDRELLWSQRTGDSARFSRQGIDA